MNDTGPDAVPPPASGSRDERICDRFTPEPEPPSEDDAFVAIPAQDRFHRVLTERMKQAEHCGCGSMPTLNHTGLLNDAC